jgi:hypothetical protein
MSHPVAAKKPVPPAPAAKPAAKKAAPAKKPAAPVKAAAEATPAPESKPAAPPLAPKVKEKLVRDSFTMPGADFVLIDQLKARSLAFKRPVKKSELLRAGLQALAALNDAALRRRLEGLVPIKAGRPKKAG